MKKLTFDFSYYKDKDNYELRCRSRNIKILASYLKHKIDMIVSARVRIEKHFSLILETMIFELDAQLDEKCDAKVQFSINSPRPYVRLEVVQKECDCSESSSRPATRMENGDSLYMRLDLARELRTSGQYQDFKSILKYGLRLISRLRATEEEIATLEKMTEKYIEKFQNNC